jgi:tRNA pseudouridine38-40 synthase
MRNIRLLIAYDGTDFHGWQRQPEAPTVQQCLESAIERVVGKKAQVCGSGRTDAGVHALNQVANFKTACRIPCSNLVRALNDALPPTVRIKEAREVPLPFHARHDAHSKTYRYRILEAAVCPPFLWRFVWHYPFPLEPRRMAEAAKLFEGEHDFTSFAAAGGSDEPVASGQDAALRPDAGPGMVRTIFSSRLLRRSRPPLVIYQVSGSGFLHHMVRNIVGTLVEVGRGKWEARDIARILAGRDRTLAGPTAPAQGLCLMKVEY